MRLRGLLVLPAVVACAPAPAAPIAPRAAPVAAASAAEPISARRSRRGECDVGKAIDAFLLGQETTHCGRLPWRPADADYERARACTIEAQRARRAFEVVWGGPEIDSSRFEAIAGRAGGDGYEVRWFSYDSCPSGCGADDPQWSSVRCEPLVDLRAACNALPQQKKTGDDELRWLCEVGDERKMRRRLELRCNGRGEPQVCGPTR